MTNRTTTQREPSPQSGDPAILAQLAPAVTRLIERSIFSSKQKQNLKEQLANAITFYPEHEWLERRPDISYNPLPARLVEILLRESHCTDYATVEVALSLSTTPIVDLSTSKALSVDAYTAYALDTLRHLHYDIIAEEIRTEILKKLALENEPIAQMTGLPRLHVLYDAAFCRASQRFLGEDEV
ncbi:MAG: hypothetical protein ACO3XO_04880 [Bdellovibrionota bacterium]